MLTFELMPIHPVKDYKDLSISIEGELFFLNPDRALYWKSENTLIVTDLHLGKIHHFRNAGIYLPLNAAMDNYERLSSLLLQYQPVSLLILGDLFHSKYNQDWETFADLRSTFSQVVFKLILGNHDIIDFNLLRMNDIELHSSLEIGPFLFSHQSIADLQIYQIGGHVHPGVKLVSSGRQSLRMPCFYFGKHEALLPAFGTFTGLGLIKPAPGSRVFVISENQVAEVFG